MYPVRRRQRGQIVPIAALLMIVLVGFAALAVDAGRGYVDRRQLQDVSDTAALSGANQLTTTGHSRTDLSYARAAAINEAVLNLPGTAVPTGYAMSDAGGSGPLSSDITGLSLGNSYTVDVTAGLVFVTVKVHHQLPLTFGAAAKLAAFSPATTATAVNGNLPFALVLFRNNTQGGFDAGDLQLQGTNVQLSVGVAASAPAGTTADTLTNESICANSSSTVNFNHTGDLYAYVPSWSKFPGGSCGGTANVLNTKSGQVDIAFPYQVTNPSYPEPPACSTGSCLHNTTYVVNNSTTNGFVCVSPGTYNAGIDVKNNNAMYMLPGVYRITSGGFQVESGTAATLDQLPLADLGQNGCPTVLPVDTGVTIEMTPTGSQGQLNPLMVKNGTGTLNIHSSASLNHIAVYVETPGNNPCAWNATQGCGSQVVQFQGGSNYSVGGVIYGYSDNMVFGGQAGGSGIGQVFAWTITVNGGGQVSETYDPSQIPHVHGLLN